MGKRSIVLFAHRHKLLLSIVSFVFFQLPQYIESLWSLYERASRGASYTGGGSSVDMTWLYFVTVPLGLLLLGSVYWMTR